jgi:hypothetical protein
MFSTGMGLNLIAFSMSMKVGFQMFKTKLLQSLVIKVKNGPE